MTYCQHCGKPYYKVNHTQRFCCKKCRIAHAVSEGKKARERAAVKRTLTCPTCGKVFTTTHAHKKYCSRECHYKITCRKQPIYQSKKVNDLTKEEMDRLYYAYMPNLATANGNTYRVSVQY